MAELPQLTQQDMAHHIDAEQIRAEIERLEGENNCGTSDFIEAKRIAYNQVKKVLDTLPEQPVEYPTSTEMIAEWENNELPLLRDKDFRGDAERMAYNAFMDGFAKGLGYKK